MKRFLAIVCLLALALTSASMTALATGDELPDNIVIEEIEPGEPDAEPKADVLVWRYRTYNGVLQKRRWNETQNCWYDPAWINV